MEVIDMMNSKEEQYVNGVNSFTRQNNEDAGKKIIGDPEAIPIRYQDGGASTLNKCGEISGKRSESLSGLFSNTCDASTENSSTPDSLWRAPHPFRISS